VFVDAPFAELAGKAEVIRLVLAVPNLELFGKFLYREGQPDSESRLVLELLGTNAANPFIRLAFLQIVLGFSTTHKATAVVLQSGMRTDPLASLLGEISDS
jgi:hypothetical protein